MNYTVECSGQTDVIYTDFAKAFDTVPHDLLVKKLVKMGFSGNLLSWLKSYLSNRYQCVVLDGVTSSMLKVTSGVPQGSILGPLLFLIYINDLPEVLKHSSALLFADDTKIYRMCNVNCVDDCKKLQCDLDALLSWCTKWRLNVNIAKCKILSVTKSRSPVVFDYHINGILVERVSEFNDLGILIQNNLSWNSHVKKTVAKARKMLGLIRRTVGYKAPQSVKLQLYTTLVRSNLEYCTQAWNSLTLKNRLKIERVQRAASRYILDYPDARYPERLSMLNLLPLSFRRDLLDLNFFYKCLNGQYELDLAPHVQFTCNNSVMTRSSQDPNLLRVPLCKATTFKGSYFNRLFHSWNKLPLDTRTSETVWSFSHKLKLYFKSLLSKFNPECCCSPSVNCVCLKNVPP